MGILPVVILREAGTEKRSFKQVMHSSINMYPMLTGICVLKGIVYCDVY